MLERLARRQVLDLEPYSWEESSEQVAARHGLRERDVLRFDLNTSPFAPGPWDAAMEAVRLERKPNEYFDTSYAQLSAAAGAYCGVPADRVVIGAGADDALGVARQALLGTGAPVVRSAPPHPPEPVRPGR